MIFRCELDPEYKEQQKTKSEKIMTNETKDKQPMSKSQKKRLKRNKAKKRAEDEQQGGSPSSSTKEQQQQQQQARQDPLNPHAKLRHDLLSLGYSVEEIDNGMEEMWNLGMKYDELEAATSFLEDKRELWANEVNVQATTVVSEDVAATAVAEDGDEVVVSEDLVLEDEKEEVVTVEKDEDLSASQPDETTATPEDVNEEGSGEAESEAVPAMDLISKLEVVSDFENLQDALFALSEWVNKAAKSDELFEFCGVKDEASSSPFATILKRSIAYTGTDDEYYRSILLPYLHSLLSGVLVGHVDTALVVDQLLNVIYLSRSSIKQLSVGSLPSSVGDNISMAVSRLISGLVHKNLVSNAAGGATSADSPQLDLRSVSNEMVQMLSQVESQRPTIGCGVVELMTERDCRKCLAEKACDLSKLLLQSLLNEMNGSTSHQTTFSASQQLLQCNEAKLTMFSSFLGEHSTTVNTGVRSYRDIETRIKNLQSDLTIKHAEVASESLRLHSDLQHIARRKNELLLELEQLERNEVRLQTREAELTKILTSAESGSEVAFLQSQRDELVGMVRTDDSLRSLVDKMSEFEMVLFVKKPENGDVGMQQQTSSFEDSVSAEDVESKMTLLMEQMQNYFHAEAAIIEFLQDRVNNMKAEHKELQLETVQFAAMGLTTNVNQMKQSLDEISRNITEDESVLSALRLEAAKMESSLCERIKDYVNAPTGSCVLSSVHRAALSNIIQSLRISDVDGVSKLSSFLPPSDINESRSVPIATPPIIRQPAPQPPQQQPQANAPVSLKPMLNWATMGRRAPAQKKEVKSLLDIQKEEMSAKQAST